MELEQLPPIVGDGPVTSARLATALAAFVDSLPAGMTLPSERKLANHYEVSRETVQRALRILQNADLVTARHGAGWSVCPRLTVMVGIPRAIVLGLVDTLRGEKGPASVLDVAAALERYLAVPTDRPAVNA